MVSPRRAGVISPAGRLDDRFMVGPPGHATGAGPAAMAGLTGNQRVWKGTPVVGQPPNPPIGPTAPQGARAGVRARAAAALVTPWPASPERLASLRNEPAARGSRARPRHARAGSPWRGKLKMGFLIVFPLLLAWALLPASAKPGAGRPFGQDRTASAAPAPDTVRLASLVNAERSRRGLPTLSVLPRLSGLAGAQSARMAAARRVSASPGWPRPSSRPPPGRSRPLRGQRRGGPP